MFGIQAGKIRADIELLATSVAVSKPSAYVEALREREGAEAQRARARKFAKHWTRRPERFRARAGEKTSRCSLQS